MRQQQQMICGAVIKRICWTVVNGIPHFLSLCVSFILCFYLSVFRQSLEEREGTERPSSSYSNIQMCWYTNTNEMFFCFSPHIFFYIDAPGGRKKGHRLLLCRRARSSHRFFSKIRAAPDTKTLSCW
jgi:hypothetical protein